MWDKKRAKSYLLDIGLKSYGFIRLLVINLNMDNTVNSIKLINIIIFR
jgi:hypothetical protein